MSRKTVPIIASLLLLAGMLTSASSPAEIGNVNTLESENSFSDKLTFDTLDNEETRIVGHRISPLELEDLKKRIGVWEEGMNLNQKINVHGTGLRPPTEEEWVNIANNLYKVEEIQLVQPVQAPSSVDHTTTPWFPPIGNQMSEGSCVAWAVGYYIKTFQEAKEHGWDLSQAEWKGVGPTADYQDKIFSPDFIYHLINGGLDQGSTFFDAINLVCAVGASSWKEMPYDTTNSTRWPSESAWREAPLYRGTGGTEILELNTDEGLTSLKNWIASGHLAGITVDANQYSTLSNKDVWTLDWYENPSLNHANTIVGYDDNLEYTENGRSRQGAFKIANSWGVGLWEENVPDGCYWISYGTMKQVVQECYFYRDLIGYSPVLVSTFRIEHSDRVQCEVSIGIGNHTNPVITKFFNEFVDGGHHPFGSNKIVFDITEFRNVTPIINQPFFMETYDGGLFAHSGDYMWHSGGESYSWFRLGQTFDIPEAGATLKFWNYFEIEEDWDYGYVEVHDLDTDEWYTLPGLRTVSTLPEIQDNPNCPSEFEPSAYFDAGRWNAFTGFSKVMYQEEMDLTPFATHTIELYFTYWTDPYVMNKGWFIDDIGISEIGFFDDVEAGSGDWAFNGWYITTSEEPVTGSISSFSIEFYYQNYGSESFIMNVTSTDVPVDTRDQEYVYADLTLENAFDWNHYHSYAEIEEILLIFNSSYSSIVDVFSIGESWQGQPIYCVRLTNKTQSEPKPQVLFVGYHHSREPISAELPLYFVMQSASSYGTDETITDMINLCEVYVIVALNPDGFSLFEINDLQRKNAHPIDEDGDGLLDEDPPEDIDGNGCVEYLYNTTSEAYVGWEGNDGDGDGEFGEDWIGGVDLNRNYAFAWNASTQSGSADPSSEDYRGSAPFSEPETQSLKDLVLQNDFDYAVAFHSGAEVIIYPWSHTTETPPDAETFEEIGEDLSTIINVPYGQSSNMYTMSGSWQDWMYGVQGIIALTCEIFANATEWFQEPGPTFDTEWRGGLRYAFNPRPSHIENVILKWLPTFTYITERAIAEFVAGMATDLNKDGTVNILDIAMVAQAYGAIYNETDGLYWHYPPCNRCPHPKVVDLDDNGVVNILDIAKVAKDFGKHFS